ncbi:DUF624 domain-containing protein [Phytohabitans sp. ZYX-F-186]|uniref:DUF624 domain-containing protein n=1 Tax=Phytohabitans maris TaxID=3071409 RepID=A0ABU0ZR62_9ACTN|nr:DUF624 domain-containing protein [Phytohabitans sp. ZYX-F-186]MDQ7909231.1 DUF624 domain-containing protein [Phytohabitans sp. ZYX-F-186]
MKRLVLFGECLLAGLLTALLALPLVTLLPALAAGCAHIRAHVDGETTAVRAYFARFRAAFPGSLKLSLAVVAAFAVAIVDGLFLRAAVPGGAFVAAFAGLAAVTLSVVLLRAAATWSPGRSWPDLVRQAAARAATSDPSGSLLLVMALALLVLVTWQLLPLALPMLGCVLMAAVAVERRYAVILARP